MLKRGSHPSPREKDRREERRKRSREKPKTGSSFPGKGLQTILEESTRVYTLKGDAGTCVRETRPSDAAPEGCPNFRST